MAGRVFSEDVRAYIFDNYNGVGPTKMSTILNKKFGTAYRAAQLMSFYSNNRLNSGVTGYFQKGSVPYNKGKKYPGKINSGCFNKGHRPKNAKPVGREITRVDGYIYIKIAQPNLWIAKHKLGWQDAFGKIPKGHCLMFIDGDTTNTKLSNLKLISRKELAIANNRHLLQGKTKEQGILTAELIGKISEAKRKVKGKING